MKIGTLQFFDNYKYLKNYIPAEKIILLDKRKYQMNLINFIMFWKCRYLCKFETPYCNTYIHTISIYDQIFSVKEAEMEK